MHKRFTHLATTFNMKMTRETDLLALVASAEGDFSAQTRIKPMRNEAERLL